MSFSYYRSVTVDHTKCGTADSSNFAVLVSISAQTYIKVVGSGGHVQNSNGYDIGFYSDSALTTKLNWEVEFYDGTAGTLVAWVKVSTLSHTADTVFYMAYGDASISTFQGNVNGTWDSNFVGVWHLPNGTSLTANDSTSTADNGTVNGSVSATAGQIDGGALWASSGTPNISLSNTSQISNINTFTISAWINTTFNSARAAIYSENSSTVSTTSLIFDINSDKLNLFFRSDIGDLANPSSSASVDDGTWKYVAIVRSASNAFTLYINGSADGTDSTTVGTTTVNRKNIGLALRAGSSDFPFLSGKVDEVRVSKTNRSTSWLTSEYNSQSNPGTFITIGSEIPISTGSLFGHSTLDGLSAMGPNQFTRAE